MRGGWGDLGQRIVEMLSHFYLCYSDPAVTSVPHSAPQAPVREFATPLPSPSSMKGSPRPLGLLAWEGRRGARQSRHLEVWFIFSR